MTLDFARIVRDFDAAFWRKRRQQQALPVAQSITMLVGKATIALPPEKRELTDDEIAALAAKV